ncbi:MAG: Benzene 1,2-dioxygenase subunit beta [Alphaproteobacteria bacterium MarineAlpha11_Bin1]|nr:MAG: Benzene 1,2-dioxygenase subunit beta [Alphaproteobacteria bacterium MarineAlpha11_Bin1]|tara:strand:- start:21454 stop:21966 length:513 start_codon:yes stop_codon:yes gene_type:complete
MSRNLTSSLDEILFAKDVELFLYHELELLDSRRFEEWTDLFTEKGYYWAPATVDQENPTSGVSLFFDDVPMMRTRFARLNHPRVHSQIPASRTSHMVSNIAANTPDKEGRFQVTAKFEMLEYRPGHIQRSFGGKYDYQLLAEDNRVLKIVFKKATIINCDDVHLPIAIPF